MLVCGCPKVRKHFYNLEEQRMFVSKHVVFLEGDSKSEMELEKVQETQTKDIDGTWAKDYGIGCPVGSHCIQELLIKVE